ncbi:hypothetical protein VV869_10475 [Photobacterium sp. MCCC 1A19761]|uniref:hypothetical protein n=1 Tax=Photobacterium sp. MCCC 1A19761 TaxID=3115000 RepID=UPI00307D7E97
MQFKYSVLATSLVAALTLAGCGGSSSSAPNTTEVTVSQGQFIDAPVEGLYYVAKPSGKSGLTDAKGTYEMAEGDTITFYLGGENGLRLGSTSARAVTSPFEVTGNYQKALNLARILQTMDNAGDGAITLPDSIKSPGSQMLAALNDVQLHDLASADKLKNELSATDWVSEEAALSHLNNSLAGLERGSKELLTDWHKGSGKYLRTIDTTLTAKNASDSAERLYVQADQLLSPELFHATRGMPHTTLRLDDEQLTMLKGSNDSTISESWAAQYLTCLTNGGQFAEQAGKLTCDGQDNVTANPQFDLSNKFSYSLLAPHKVAEQDEAFPWSELTKFGGILACMAEQNCSEAKLTGFTITGEYDDSDAQDGSEMQKDVLSTSYDAVTGVYTEVKKRTMTKGEHTGRISHSLAFSYLVDGPDAERYVDFKGTWKVLSTSAKCNGVAVATMTFNDQGVVSSGQEFNDCTPTDLESTLYTYADLAKMDYWWFTTNGAGNDRKATLAQLNTTVRWCDNESNPNVCPDGDIKFNRWEYIPAGENWDQGILNRRTLSASGEVISTMSYQKQ